MGIKRAGLVAGLFGALALSCTDPNPTFVFDAAPDLPREASAADSRPDGTGSAGDGGSAADGGAR